MNITQLEYFTLIHQLGSINKVAEQKHISPQTISASIKKLEEELQYPLFIRNGKQNLALSPYGELFIQTANDILSILHLGISKMDNYNAAPQNENIRENLNILISPALNNGIIPTIAETFLKNNPHINLKIINEETANILSLITQGDAAGFFMSFKHFSDTEDIVYKHIYTDKIYAAFSPNHILAKQKTISLATLLRHPLTIFQNSYTSPNPVCGILEEVTAPNYYTVTNNYQIYQNVIYNNKAIGFINKSSIRSHTALPNIIDKIIVRPIKNFPPIYLYMAVASQYFSQHRVSIMSLVTLFKDSL